MPSIRELPSDVINKIAAGEVVERPAQLLKELLENSLDAQATEITIDVKNGGRSIQVVDNGHGIPGKELKLVLARHTTSKIIEVDDLWKLMTFGFRGEALASISSISRVQLISRLKSEAKASRLDCEFGRLSEVETVSAPVGTSLLVEDLFENVPARLKFLKSSGAEVSAIRQTLRGVALSHPQVTFRLRVEESLDLFWAAVETRLERAIQVLEQDSMYVGERVAEDYSVTVAFSDPGTIAKTSKNIWIFAQGRWIQDRGLQAAVTEAYRGTLMHGEYPIAVIWLQVPPDEIDVNIHPTKAQVKFQDSSKVFRLVHHTIRDELERQHSSTKVYVPPQPANLSFSSGDLQRTYFQQKDLPSVGLTNQASTGARPRSAELGGERALPNFAPQGSGPTDPRQPADWNCSQAAPNNRGAAGIDSSSPAGSFSLSATAPSGTVGIEGSSHLSQVAQWGGLQVLGQALLTYIVAQEQNQIVFVDQHAAHERVLFETIIAGWKQGQLDRQGFLFPITIELTADKVEALLKYQNDFEKLSILIEAMGPSTIGVSATPPFLKESVLPSLLDQVATEILDFGGSYSFEKKMNDIAATMACHSAIRAGQALSVPEMQALLQQMDQFSFSSFCPHGRPVAVRWSQGEIEREFGRRP